MCPRTLSDRHDQTETDRALWFFSTGPQWTNSNLQTGFRSIGCLVVEKSRFSDRGWWFGKVCPRTFSDRQNQTEAARALRFYFNSFYYLSQIPHFSYVLYFSESVLAFLYSPTESNFPILALFDQIATGLGTIQKLPNPFLDPLDLPPPPPCNPM